MKQILKIFIYFVLTFSFSLVFAQKKYSLNESIQTGITNSKDLKISGSKKIVSNAKIDEISSQFLPSLKFNVGYSRLSDVPPFSISVPFYPKPIQISDVILNNYTFRFSVQQPVFTGFRLSSQKNSSEYLFRATEYDELKDLNELAYNINFAFWNFKKAKMIKKILLDNIETIEKHLDDTKNFYKNGMATENDILKLELTLSNAKLALLEAEGNIESARILFNRAIGVNISENTDIEVENINITDDYNNITTLIATAYLQRKEINSIELRINASNENIIAARSSYYPSVFLSGNYYFNQPNSRYQPPLNQFKGSWDLGINLSWDIWNWRITSSQIIQAEQMKLQNETSLQILKENIEIEVRQNFIAYNLAKEKILLTEKAINLAVDNKRLIDEKYKFRIATSTDLIDAQNSHLQSNVNYTIALIDYQTAKIKLEKSFGKILYKL
jgi:outer membrane protein TolC